MRGKRGKLSLSCECGEGQATSLQETVAGYTSNVTLILSTATRLR